MTYLAKEEKKENGEAFRIMEFYKYDFIRYNLIKNFLSVTVGYILLLALAALYKAEYLIANVVLLDYKQIGMVLIAIYLVVLLVYSIITVYRCSIQYEESKKQVGRYYKMLDVLRRFYDKQLEQK